MSGVFHQSCKRNVELLEEHYQSCPSNQKILQQFRKLISGSIRERVKIIKKEINATRQTKFENFTLLIAVLLRRI